MVLNHEKMKAEVDAQDTREAERGVLGDVNIDSYLDGEFASLEVSALLADLRRPAGDFTLMDGDIIDRIEKG